MVMQSEATQEKQISFEVKSGLAKLLAAENITMRHDGASKTAYFDVKSRVLVLPVWKNISEHLYDMLVVHEVGHALNTPAEGWVSAVQKIAEAHHKDFKTLDFFKKSKIENNVRLFLNVVEDARIDKLQKRRYPGTKRDYVVGYKELNEELDFFGLKSKDVNSMMFIDRANIYFKSSGLHIVFNPTERAFIKRMENLETWDEVVQVTSDIYIAAKEELEQKQAAAKADCEASEGQDGQDGDDIEIDVEMTEEELEELQAKNGDGSEQDDQKSSKGPKVKVNVKIKESEEKSDEKGDGKSKDKSGDDKSDDKSKKKAKPANGAGATNSEILPTVETEEAASKSQSKIVNDNGAVIIEGIIPEMILKLVVDDYPVVLHQQEEEIKTKHSVRFPSHQKDFLEWRRSETETISFMVKEFEMKKAADAYARIRTAKTGTIDMNKLTRYKFDDDLFRKVSVVPKGKNHGFFLIMDWSGSMTSNIQNTAKQLLSLVMFCKRVNIPFEVYIFRSGGCYVDSNQHYSHSLVQKNPSGFNIGSFKLRNVLSSRMKNTDFLKACQFFWFNSMYYPLNSDLMNGTPLNQSILACSTLVNDFKKKNKIQIPSVIVLTDGQSDHTSWNYYTSHQRNTFANSGRRRQDTQYLLKDPVTKKTYWIKDPNGYEMTSTFLKVLKSRTDANIVGFYLHHNPSLGGMSYMFDMTVLNNPKNVESWKTNNYFSVKDSSGYDEHYALYATNKKPDDSLNIKSTMTVNAMSKQFAKFSSKKKANRALLTSFVDRISKEN